MKKTLLFILLALFSLNTVLHTVHAQESGWDPLDPRFQESVAGSNEQGEMSLPSATANTLMSQIATINCAISGAAACAPEGTKPASYYRNYGLIPNIHMATIAMLTNPPVNTGIWLADTGRSLGFLPKQTHAQGVGFSGLSPILPLWKTFRNLSYVLLALIMMVIGFMIMFRTRIDPHTVANIQIILPRVVISLILITFSYAIVGLLIDLSYVVLFFSYGLFRSAGLPATIPIETNLFGITGTGISTQEVYLSGNLFNLLQTVFPNGLSDIATLVQNLTGLTAESQALASGLIAGATGLFLSGGNPLAGLVTGAVGAITIPLLLQLLVGLLLLILIIRIFFMILSAYVQIILLTILGPIQLVLGTIPGRNNFTAWIRTVAANISVFVLVGVMFMLSSTFVALTSGMTNQAIWSPPYFPFHIMSNNVGAFFVIGILMMIPDAAKQLKKAIIGEQDANMAMGGAIFGGLSGVTALGMQAYHMWESRSINRELGNIRKAQKSGGAEGGGHP